MHRFKYEIYLVSISVKWNILFNCFYLLLLPLSHKQTLPACPKLTVSYGSLWSAYVAALNRTCRTHKAASSKADSAAASDTCPSKMIYVSFDHLRVA